MGSEDEASPAPPAKRGQRTTKRVLSEAHVFMVRPHLEGIPPPLPPKGFHLVAYRPGDEAAWLEIIRLSYGGKWPEEAFQKCVASDESFRPERLFFAAQAPKYAGCFTAGQGERPAFGQPATGESGRVIGAPSAGKLVGTAGAFQKLWHGDHTGYVHMMGVLPEFQRRGLGTALLRRCLLYFREQGWRDAVLDTESARLPAIRLYLAHGFRPAPEVEGDVQRWREVLAKLNLKGTC